MFKSTGPFSKLVLAVLAGCIGVFAQVSAIAQQTNDVPNPRQYDLIEADEFIKEASAKNLAEIEAAKVAMESASSREVKEYAQHMIEDHKKANQKLKEIAKKKNIEVSDDPALMDQAKKMVLEQRDESFDEAYANNQVSAHKQTIDLFQRAANSNDPDIKDFANQTLPKLKQHLDKARELVQVTEEAEGNV